VTPERPTPGDVLMAMRVLFSLLCAFLLGVWWGSRDRLCVTAPTGSGTIVWCAAGEPRGSLTT